MITVPIMTIGWRAIINVERDPALVRSFKSIALDCFIFIVTQLRPNCNNRVSIDVYLLRDTHLSFLPFCRRNDRLTMRRTGELDQLIRRKREGKRVVLATCPRCDSWRFYC